MKIAKKRDAGDILGREGLALRIIELAKDISDGSYKNAMERAGQIAVLVEASTFDDYWNGKAKQGQNREQEILTGLIEGWILVDRAKRFCNPYPPKSVTES